jgi:hypothetical protein
MLHVAVANAPEQNALAGAAHMERPTQAGQRQPVLQRWQMLTCAELCRYTGHVPVARPHPYGADAAQVRSHDKAFYLLPENYKHQGGGYTGRNMPYARFTAACDRGRQ